MKNNNLSNDDASLFPHIDNKKAECVSKNEGEIATINHQKEL